MAKYYRLDTDLANLKVYVSRASHRNRKYALDSGQPLSVDPDPPFLFDVEGEDEIVPGQPIRIPAYASAGPIFDRKLIEVIQSAGVDNLELFPAVLRIEATGEEIRDSHLAVNILGLVSCADMDESEAEPIAGSHFFLKLKIDPEKTGDMLMFRVAEQPLEIIVHEKVAHAIQEGNFFCIVLEEVS